MPDVLDSYRVVYDEKTKTAVLQHPTQDVSEGYVDAGTFDHDGTNPLCNGVRDRLYFLNVLDMPAVTIKYGLLTAVEEPAE